MPARVCLFPHPLLPFFDILRTHLTDESPSLASGNKKMLKFCNVSRYMISKLIYYFQISPLPNAAHRHKKIQIEDSGLEEIFGKYVPKEVLNKCQYDALWLYHSISKALDNFTILCNFRSSCSADSQVEEFYLQSRTSL